MGAPGTRAPRCVRYLDDLMHFDWTNVCVRLRERPLIYQVSARSCSSDTVRQRATGQTGKDITATFELLHRFQHTDSTQLAQFLHFLVGC